MTNCRAEAPATCRTHGVVIRQDMAIAHRYFENLPPFTLLSQQSTRAAIANLKFENEASYKVLQNALDDTWSHLTPGGLVPAPLIAEHINDQVQTANGKLHTGPMDYSDYPLSILKDHTLESMHNVRTWLRDHGIPLNSPDTVFGTEYVYCGSHVRPHKAGWCEVPVYNKGPLQGTDRESVYAETRALGLPIYGDKA